MTLRRLMGVDYMTQKITVAETLDEGESNKPKENKNNETEANKEEDSTPLESQLKSLEEQLKKDQKNVDVLFSIASIYKKMDKNRT